MKEKNLDSKTRDRKQLWIVFALIVVAGSVTAMIVASTPEPTKTGGTLEERYKTLMEKSVTMHERPEYFTSYVQDNMFGELEDLYPFPQDFYEKRVMYQYNVIDYRPEFYTDAYTMQPEWTYSDEDPYNKIVDYLNKWSPQAEQIWGLGLYPKYYKIKINGNEQHTIPLDIWITSVPATKSYNGVHMEVVYPSVVNMVSTEEFEIPADKIVQNPTETKKYFTATATPEDFVLAPNFPVYKVNGENTYRQKVTITITSKEGTPKGRYSVGLDAQPPSDDYNQEQLNIFGLDYKPTRGAVTQSSKEFRVLIDVI